MENDIGHVDRILDGVLEKLREIAGYENLDMEDFPESWARGLLINAMNELDQLGVVFMRAGGWTGSRTGWHEMGKVLVEQGFASPELGKRIGDLYRYHSVYNMEDMIAH